MIGSELRNSSMVVRDLVPQSQEWHEWRSQGIGASEIAVLLGDDPYKTPYQLWEEKCGYAKKRPLTSPMRWGIANEEKARSYVNASEKLKLEPLCVEDSEIPYIRASLDGWDSQSEVLVEIKCPTSTDTLDVARKHGAVHSYWIDQIQWQMMIAKPLRAYLALYDPRIDGCIVLQQWPDEKLHLKMREKAAEFWEMVRMGRAPDLTDRDYKEISDTNLEVLLKEYELSYQQEKEARAVREKLRPLILSYGEGENFKAHGWAARFCPGRTTYDTKQMILDGLDLEKYAKEGKSSFVLRPLKGE